MDLMPHMKNLSEKKVAIRIADFRETNQWIYNIWFSILMLLN